MRVRSGSKQNPSDSFVFAVVHIDSTDSDPIIKFDEI